VRIVPCTVKAEAYQFSAAAALRAGELATENIVLTTDITHRLHGASEPFVYFASSDRSCRRVNGEG
jgi:hypothetical protein